MPHPARDRLAALLLGIASTAAPAASAQNTAPPATLTIQTDKPLHKVSPTLYGLMTEEINYSYDGGLYAELVRNRVIRDTWSALDHWSVVQNGSAQASISVDKTTGPSQALPVSMLLNVTSASAGNEAGVINDGWWGIPLKPNTTYKASFYAKADSSSAGPITVSVVNSNSGKVEASATAEALTTEWKPYSVTLKTGQLQASTQNFLRLTIKNSGKVWLDLVSLFPPTYNNTPNGNRIDLMEKLAAMTPKFLRLPGGNYLEGDNISDWYNWKKTIGPLVDRPTHPSPWRYQSSDGMGLLEFLEWCEDLHIQPVLAVYAGYSLKGDHVTPGPDLLPYVESALDEIEYVTGGPDTKWGAERVKDGHPATFPLTYVEIGNEDEFDKSGSYNQRFAQFYDAIRKKYPQLQLIATTPVTSRKPDVIDDHFYRHAEEFFTDTHHYDNTDRNGPKIFVGEWATREGSPTPNFGAALGDAAWLTGLERNSDIVVMASYAPLLTNINPGGMQWETDLIGYNALDSYGSPAYYTQVIFDKEHGDEVLDSQQQGGGPRFFYSVTRDAAEGVVYIKLVNASSVPQPVKIDLAGAANVTKTARLVALAAETTQETNSITDPTHIVPEEKQVGVAGANFDYTVPRYAIQVLEVKVK